MVVYETPTCFHCGKSGFLELTEAEVAALEVMPFVQNALPNRTADEREQVMTGTHASCWAEMFPDEDDDEDDPTNGFPPPEEYFGEDERLPF